MAFVHKIMFAWFMVLVFLILLVVKLDGRIDEWNWFIIFIPMWILDFVVAVYCIINMIMHCKNKWWHNVRETSLKRKLWSLIAITLKIVFQVLLCLRLHYVREMSLFFVLTPLWLFNGGCIVEVCISLAKLAKRPV